MASADITIRPAIPQDKEAVLRFTEHTWEFGDYISEVWDQWIGEPNTRLLVAALQDLPVAIIHLVVVGPGEGWLEGLRVDPTYRRGGIANRLMQYCMQESATMGVQTLRFATSSLNTPIHHLSDDLGFKKITSLQSYEAPLIPGEEIRIDTASIDDLPALKNYLSDSVMLKAMGGLFATGWRFHCLNAEKLEKLVHSGKVRVLREGKNISAWAAVEKGLYGNHLVITFADGTSAKLKELAIDIRKEAARLNNTHAASIRLPESLQLQQIFKSAGYAPTDDPPFWIYSISL